MSFFSALVALAVILLPLQIIWTWAFFYLTAFFQQDPRRLIIQHPSLRRFGRMLPHQNVFILNRHFKLIVAIAPVSLLEVLLRFRLPYNRLRFVLKRDSLFKLVTLTWVVVRNWLPTWFVLRARIQIWVHNRYYLFSNYWILQWRFLAASRSAAGQAFWSYSFICFIVFWDWVLAWILVAF